MRRGRSGKSLDLDDDIDEDTMEALRRLLRPSDLSRLRDKILTDNKRTGRKKQNRSDRKRPKRRQQSKESAERLRQAKEVPRKKVVKDKIRTILEPGQLHKIRETGTFDDVDKKEFVDKIREDIKEKDFTNEEGILKKWAKEGAAKASGTSEMYQAIKAENKELKRYTLAAISDEDFIFTDWEAGADPVRGIKGPDEVRRRIQEYLVINKIRTKDNLDI